MGLPARALAGFLICFAVAPALAWPARQITDFRTDRLGEYSLDDAGITVVAVTSADPFGMNPYHEYQATAWTGAGAGSTLTRFGGLLTSISVSDDGEWLAFASVADPLGENPSASPVAFLQSADGSVLRQLPAQGGPVRISGSGNRVLVGGTVVDVASGVATPGVAGGDSSSISDDGNAVVYSSGGRVYRVQADGTDRVRLTPDGVVDATAAMISGDGQRVTYESGGQIYVMDATGGAALLIGPGHDPSITDDHAWVYYSAPDSDNLEIWRAQIVPRILQRLTRTAPPLSNDRPQVSGDGSRVAFVRRGTVADRAEARILMRMNSDGSAVEQLGAPEADFRSWDAEITPDGTRVVFVAGPPDRYDVYRVQADGSNLVRITNGAAALHPSVSGDGATIVFESSLDLTGDNPCGTPQIFRITADGSGLARLSPSGSCAARQYPVISRDGSTVVYQQHGGWLFAMPATGGVPSPIVMDSSVYPKLPRLSGDGSLVVYESDSLAGQVQAFVARTDGTSVTRISVSPLAQPRPDISADGSRIGYGDWDGTPNYYYQDLWLYSPQTSTRAVLTEYFFAADTRISGDGEHVYFLNGSLRRRRLATGQMESFSGYSDPRSVGLSPASPGSDTAYQVDHTGRIVLSWSGNWTGENPDLNQEIWIVDPDATPQWDIEPGAPARIRFTPDVYALHYDLIRGDLQGLGLADDGTVDLDAVVCLLDDAPTTTAVDPEQPGPGQGFFYLYGIGGNWGTSSSGAPRVPGSGACGAS